jgi:hypothetical protein
MLLNTCYYNPLVVNPRSMSQPISEAVKEYLKEIASKGGKAGKGEAKVRGDRAYYRRISAMAARARKANAARRRSG